MNDSLGDRMKQYESQTQMQMMPLVPVIARLDGKSFHTFTKGLSRPFDVNLSNLMINTTRFLVRETNARIGYTQSDEITLVYFSDNIGSQILFDGKLLKMTSVLASMCSVFFNKNLDVYLPSKMNEMPVFDCRVFNVPSMTEAVNCLIWREKDATRNSVSMAAQSEYPHADLQNKSHDEKIEMLSKVGINWNNYPTFFKRGTYVRRMTKFVKYSAQEIDKLPPQHQARTNPHLMVERSVVETMEFPPMTRITNRVGVVFNGEVPQISSEII